MKNKKPRRNHESSDSTASRFIKSTAIGLASSITLILILSFIFSAVALLFKDPNRLIFGFSLSALFISAFFGGFIAARINSSSSLLCGLVTGTLLLVLLLFFSFAFKFKGGTTGISTVLMYRISAPLFSIIGAYSGLAGPKVKPRRR